MRVTDEPRADRADRSPRSTTTVPSSTATSDAATPEDLPWRERKKRLSRQALHDTARDMVLESGLAAVTIEAICARAGLAPRTFFHYFPTKAAAALGLLDLGITEDQRARFLQHDSGDLVVDLCALVVEVISNEDEHFLDRRAKHELVQRRPELLPDLFHWVARLRRQFFALAEERSPGAHSRAAVTLTMAALTEALGLSGGDEGDFEQRLWANAAALCAAGARSDPALHRDAIPIGPSSGRPGEPARG